MYVWFWAKPDDNDLHQLHRMAEVRPNLQKRLVLQVVNAKIIPKSRYFGGFSASLSSAIASMVGAPRILQVAPFLWNVELVRSEKEVVGF